MADRRAGTLVVEGRARAADIVLVARRDAQAGDVDQQVLAFLPHARRQLARGHRGDAFRQVLGNGLIGES